MTVVPPHMESVRLKSNELNSDKLFDQKKKTGEKKMALWNMTNNAPRKIQGRMREIIRERILCSSWWRRWRQLWYSNSGCYECGDALCQMASRLLVIDKAHEPEIVPVECNDLNVLL